MPNGPSRASLRGLDWINLFAADVQSGVGPYLSVFLTAKLWPANQMGVALAMMAAATAVCQIPAGLAIDKLYCKRAILSGACVLVGASCLVTVWFPTFWPVVVGQLILGLAAAFLGPVIGAITLGLVGQKAIAARTSRNASFNHAGSFLTALLAILVTRMENMAWIFYCVCGAAFCCALLVLLIRPGEIDHRQASGGESDEDGEPLRLRVLMTRAPFLVFLATIMLLQMGNGAMLMLAGRGLQTSAPELGTEALSACVIVAQAAMVLMAWLSGKALERGVGRKTLMLVSLAAVPLRGACFAWAMFGSVSMGETIAIQMLDGLATGIMSVLSVVIAADLTRGTGRFNFSLGLVALAIGIGSAVSNMLAGEVLQHWGFSAAYLVLAAIGAVGLALFAVGMPETGLEAGGSRAMPA